MDALSSQANVAGYKAVLLGGVGVDPVLPDADHGGGNGEAGHGAGARCRAWPGCRRWPPPSGSVRRTTGYDVRPEVADQVRSVGAQWLDLGIDAAGEGGYARELTEEERAAAAAGARARRSPASTW